MSILQNAQIEFVHAGLFQSTGAWIHPRRTEITYELICVVKGEVCLEEDGVGYRLCPGEVLLLRPGVVHHGTAYTENVSFYWLHFHAREPLPFETYYVKSFAHTSLFRELLHYNNLPQPPSELVNATLVHILAALAHLSVGEGAAVDAKAEQLYEWTRINVTAATTVAQIAAHFGYSTDHISRICKRSFGMGVRALIDRFLLARAKELLCNTEIYVKEIAATLAFGSDKAFIAFFKYHESCSPNAVRDRFGKTHMNSK